MHIRQMEILIIKILQSGSSVKDKLKNSVQGVCGIGYML